MVTTRSKTRRFATTPNPQILSPLYAILPAEIRTQVLTYALSPAPSPSLHPDTIYTKNNHYYRPGYTQPLQLYISLLRTCRKIYLETYHLPPILCPHVFWHDREPDYVNPKFACDEARYFERFQQWQLELVTRVEMFTQMYWLEEHFKKICVSGMLKNVKELKLIFRRGDWWGYEVNRPLAINPYDGTANLETTNKDRSSMMQRGMRLEYEKTGWAYHLGMLTGLQSLEIEFETSYDKRGELEKIVEWAKRWEFEMDGGRGILSQRKGGYWGKIEGVERGEGGKMKMQMEMQRRREEWLEGGFEKVRWWDWEGQVVHWSTICPFCGSTCVYCSSSQRPEDACTTKTARMWQRRGPTLVVANCYWGLRKGERIM